MVGLNIKNTENLIFYNKSVQNLLPDLAPFFHKWKVNAVKGVKTNVKKVILDFLNSINERHIKILENYFGEEVKVDNIDCDLVKYVKVGLHEAEHLLYGLKGYNNFTISRDDNYLYICFWR